MHLNARDCVLYYTDQAGGGGYFHGIAHQRGYGYFRDIGRKISPYLFKAGRYLGRQLLQTGKNIITDMSSGTPFHESARSRLRETSKKIKGDIFEKLQQGRGIKRKRGRKPNHSKVKRCKTVYKDIFA